MEVPPTQAELRPAFRKKDVVGLLLLDELP
jgi:hypothetical protein